MWNPVRLLFKRALEERREVSTYIVDNTTPSREARRLDEHIRFQNVESLVLYHVSIRLLSKILWKRWEVTTHIVDNKPPSTELDEHKLSQSVEFLECLIPYHVRICGTLLIYFPKEPLRSERKFQHILTRKAESLSRFWTPTETDHRIIRDGCLGCTVQLGMHKAGKEM